MHVFRADNMLHNTKLYCKILLSEYQAQWLTKPKG